MDALPDNRSDRIIQGPLTLTLTPFGVESFIKRGQKPKRFKLFDGTEQYGIDLPSISEKTLQRMALTGAIHRIERSVTQFMSQRSAVMDLTRCFAVATIFKQFSVRLWEILGKNELLILWNRQYPKLNIGPDMNPNNPSYTLLLQKARDSILQRKQEVLKVVQTAVMGDAKALDDEKRERLLLAIRYINAVDPSVWLLIATGKEPAASNLIQVLQKLLTQYIQRMELPEYLTLLIAELVVLVGKVQSDEGDADVAMAKLHNPVFLSMELGNVKKSQEERTKVRVQIGNETSDFAVLHSLIDQKSGMSVSERSLDTFIGKELRTGSDIASTNIGLYYLSFVRDACKRVDISLDAFVNAIPQSNRTLVNLLLAV